MYSIWGPNQFSFSDISDALSYAVVVLSLPVLPSALKCDHDRIIFTKIRIGGEILLRVF